MRAAGERGSEVGIEMADDLLTAMEGEVAGTYIMPSFGRYEQCAELVRRIRARHPVAVVGVTAFDRASRLALLPGLLRERILVLDGAMGTMLQAYKFTEADFRGERFRRPPARPARQQRPALPDPAGGRRRDPRRLPRRRRGHPQTNTFTATRIAQADYGFDPAIVRELNVAAARLARDAADAAEPPSPTGRASSPARSARPTGPPR